MSMTGVFLLSLSLSFLSPSIAIDLAAVNCNRLRALHPSLKNSAQSTKIYFKEPFWTHHRQWGRVRKRVRESERRGWGWRWGGWVREGARKRKKAKRQPRAGEVDKRAWARAYKSKLEEEKTNPQNTKCQRLENSIRFQLLDHPAGHRIQLYPTISEFTNVPRSHKFYSGHGSCWMKYPTITSITTYGMDRFSAGNFTS